MTLPTASGRREATVPAAPSLRARASLWRLPAVVRSAVVDARGSRAASLAFLAGAASVLAMAPFFWAPVLFVTLPILVWLIDGTSGPGALAHRKAAAVGWWFGFGYFAAGLFWIGEAFLVEADKFAWALPFAVTLMPAGLALFFAIATAVARVFWRPGVARLFVLAVSLACAEWLRGHILTGFPWNVLGYALTGSLPLMQAAALVGIYGLTLWTIVIAAAPLVVAADRPHQPRHAARDITLLCAGPLAVALVWGTISLRTDPAMVEGPRVRIVQPSIPQREKWQPANQATIFQQHLELSRVNPQGARDDLDGITHVVWAEAAMPFMPLDTPDAQAAIGQMLPEGVQLLSGALRLERRPAASETTPSVPFRAFNSLMVFGDDGTLSGLYDKIHLVPFGEYLPFQQTLEAIGLEQLSRMRGGFTKGAEPRRLMDIPGLPALAALICYEASFPSSIVQGEARPGLLLNVTNDGWFGRMAGPYQHFHQSRLRAVEEGLPLIRASNNGVSAVIDPQGRVLARLDLDAKGVIDSRIPVAKEAPVYAVWGDWLFVINAVAFAVVALLASGRSGIKSLEQS